MSKSTTWKCCESTGVAGSRLKWPKPAPWIWITGSPSPVIRCHRLTPLTSIIPSTEASSVVASSLKSDIGHVKLARRERAPHRADDLAGGGRAAVGRRRRGADPDRHHRTARAAHAARHRLLHRPLAVCARGGARRAGGRLGPRRPHAEHDAVLVPHAVPGRDPPRDADVLQGLPRGVRLARP